MSGVVRDRILEMTDRMVAWALALGAVGLSLVLWLGGDSRTSGPAWETLREMWGGMETWNIVWTLVAAGLVVENLTYARGGVRGRARRHARLALTHFVAGVVSLVWALSFVRSALASPEASLTGTIAYALLAAIFVAMSVKNYAMWSLGRVDDEVDSR